MQVVEEARAIGSEACSQLLAVIRGADATFAQQEAAIDHLRALGYGNTGTSNRYPSHPKSHAFACVLRCLLSSCWLIVMAES